MIRMSNYKNRITVRLDDPTYDLLKKVAIRNNVSIATIVRNAINYYVSAVLSSKVEIEEGENSDG